MQEVHHSNLLNCSVIKQSDLSSHSEIEEGMGVSQSSSPECRSGSYCMHTKGKFSKLNGLALCLDEHRVIRPTGSMSPVSTSEQKGTDVSTVCMALCEALQVDGEAHVCARHHVVDLEVQEAGFVAQLGEGLADLHIVCEAHQQVLLKRLTEVKCPTKLPDKVLMVMRQLQAALC